MNLYNLHSDPKSMRNHDLHHNNIAELIWDKYKNNPAELKKREKIIAKDPYYAFIYAKDILHGCFPLGEEAIAKDLPYAYYYARDVLHNRFQLGEEAIAKDPYCACYYAIDVLHNRFPLGEEAIAKDPEYAHWYAKDIIKGPWTINGKTYK